MSLGTAMTPDPALVAVAKEVCDQRGLVLGDMVGEGAFKQTFRASDPGGGDPLALKVFRQQGSPRTEREFDAMLRCDHPNIVSLVALDRLEVNGQTSTYCLEEFLSGGTLGQRLSHGLLSRVELVDLAGALSRAVEHIADQSLVHRDIKPDNIMFRGDGVTPVVVDFGIVRDLVRSPLTRSWVLQGPGTPFFAAPEQLTNQRELIDWRTDQFALGVTLFMCRYGYHPYGAPGQPPEQVIPLVVDRRGISQEAKASIDGDALTILSRMIKPWPVERFRRPPDLIAGWS